MVCTGCPYFTLKYMLCPNTAPPLLMSADHTHGHAGKFVVTFLDDSSSHCSLTFSVASVNLTVLLSPTGSGQSLAQKFLTGTQSLLLLFLCICCEGLEKWPSFTFLFETFPLSKIYVSLFKFIRQNYIAIFYC